MLHTLPSPSHRWVVIGVLLATGVVLVALGDRSGQTVVIGQQGDPALCGKLQGDAGRSCHQAQVGRELASVGAVTPQVKFTAPADSGRILTFTAPTAGAQPLLCALHTRIGVSSDDVPGWLTWSEPATPPS